MVVVVAASGVVGMVELVGEARVAGRQVHRVKSAAVRPITSPEL